MKKDTQQIKTALYTSQKKKSDTISFTLSYPASHLLVLVLPSFSLIIFDNKHVSYNCDFYLFSRSDYNLHVRILKEVISSPFELQFRRYTVNDVKESIL